MVLILRGTVRGHRYTGEAPPSLFLGNLQFPPHRSPLSCFAVMAEATPSDGMRRRFSGKDSRKLDTPLPPPLVPVDFGYWKLAPGGLGLLGLGVYAGFRKQIKADAIGAEALSKQGLEPLPFSPYRLATRALMYGTALSVGCFSAGVLVVGYSMGVTNLREFNDKMKVWAPEQMHRLGFRHSPEYIRDREAVRDMTYDEEWEYVDKLLEKEGPGITVPEGPPPSERGTVG